MVATKEPCSCGPTPDPIIEEQVVQPSLHITNPTTKPLDGDLDSSVGQPHETRPWEQPGAWGTTRRYLRNARRFIWDDPDKPKEEKWFLFKLDIFLLSISCLSYFSKNLDQTKINNAFVSGMKEALHLEGSELTYAGNLFTTGYVLDQIPGMILTTRPRPSIRIPTLEVLWSALTFCSAAVHNKSQLYAVRFLCGLFESAFFPIMIYLLSSWYTKNERGKRLTIFFATTGMSQMFSGYLQAGAYNGLDGKLGHSGWQWLFIVSGIISLPISILGYFFIPDFPETTRAFYIASEEAQWARDRMTKAGLKPLGASAWDRKKIFRITTQWQFWVLPHGYFFIQGSLPTYQPVFALWLKSTDHTVYQINVWPTGQYGVAVVVQILAGALSDSPLLQGRRWQTIFLLQAISLFGCVVLAVWHVPQKLHFAAYYLMYLASGTPGIYYAMYPDLIPHDHEMRGFVTACSNMFSFIQSIWFTVAVWRTAQGPRFHAGFIFSSVMGVLVIFLVFVLRFLEGRDTKRRAQEQQGLTNLEMVVPGSNSENNAGLKKNADLRGSESVRRDTSNLEE